MTKTIRIKGRDAIEWQAREGGQLRAYADAIDDAERDVEPSEAREIITSDPGLVYIDVAESTLCPLCLLAGGHTRHDGGEPVEWDCGNTEPVVRPWCATCREELGR